METKELERKRRDGRSMRRTGRTMQFATRVTQEWDDRFRDIAEERGLLLAELLEQMLDAYEQQHQGKDT